MTLEQFRNKYKACECCCFTGHRVLLSPTGELEERLCTEMENLINKGVAVFICGGALGFDTLAAQTVLRLKGKYPFIKLMLMFPCRNQEVRWQEKDKTVYNDILKRADYIHYVSQSYGEKCMLDRNDCMVELAERCICYLRKNSGGTAYTVAYAKRMGRELIML